MSDKVYIEACGIMQTDKEWGKQLGLTAEEVRFFSPIDDLVLSEDRYEEKINFVGNKVRFKDITKALESLHIPEEWLYCYAKLGILIPVCNTKYRNSDNLPCGPTAMFGTKAGGMSLVMWNILMCDNSKLWCYPLYDLPDSVSMDIFTNRLFKPISKEIDDCKKARITYWVDNGVVKTTLCGRGYVGVDRLAKRLNIVGSSVLQHHAEKGDLAHIVWDNTLASIDCLGYDVNEYLEKHGNSRSFVVDVASLFTHTANEGCVTIEHPESWEKLAELHEVFGSVPDIVGTAYLYKESSIVDAMKIIAAKQDDMVYGFAVSFVDSVTGNVVIPYIRMCNSHLAAFSSQYDKKASIMNIIKDATGKKCNGGRRIFIITEDERIQDELNCMWDYEHVDCYDNLLCNGDKAPTDVEMADLVRILRRVFDNEATI